MAFLLVYFFYRRLNISPDYLLMKEPYYKFDTYVLKGAAIRLMIYAVSFVLMLSFFNLLPNRKTLISGLGARGMYVYMLHIFINGIMIKMNVYEHPTLLTQILLIPFAILCTVILASKYTEKIFKPIFFPEYVKKLFK
ncbi:MAG: acyltransferase [Burkholderiales bacterium]|nr:acyltransferase [Burkholderiales bacterium]